MFLCSKGWNYLLCILIPSPSPFTSLICSMCTRLWTIICSLYEAAYMGSLCGLYWCRINHLYAFMVGRQSLTSDEIINSSTSHFKVYRQSVSKSTSDATICGPKCRIKLCIWCSLQRIFPFTYHPSRLATRINSWFGGGVDDVLKSWHLWIPLNHLNSHLTTTFSFSIYSRYTVVSGTYILCLHYFLRV